MDTKEIVAGFEVRREPDGTIDEIVGAAMFFHLEYMDDGHVWLGIEGPGGLLHINLSTGDDRRRAKIRASVEQA